MRNINEDLKFVQGRFIDREVPEYPYAIDRRERMQRMVEHGVITPGEYWQGLKSSWVEMSLSEKLSENTDI